MHSLCLTVDSLHRWMVVIDQNERTNSYSLCCNPVALLLKCIDIACIWSLYAANHDYVIVILK